MKKALMNRAKGKSPKKLKGFTLVELIVVMVILALLMALAIPQVTKYIDKAGDITMKSEARACYTAVQAYCVEKYESGKATGITLRDNVCTDLTGVGASKSNGTTVVVGSWATSYSKNSNSEIYAMANIPDNGYIAEIQLDAKGTAVKKLVYKYATGNAGTAYGTRYVVYENGKYKVEGS